jgi:hypothetical protein
VAKSSQEVPSRKSLYLLASQLKLAAEVSDAVSVEDLRHYLQSLQKEFITSFVPPEYLVDVDKNEEVSLSIGSTKSGGDTQTSSTLERERVDGNESGNESEDL